MRDSIPKYIIIAEQIIDVWISNTPVWMQPKIFWSLYFKALDKA